MKIKSAFFFGGRSVEHEVSVISAIQAINKLDRDKYEAVPNIYYKEFGILHGRAYRQNRAVQRHRQAAEKQRQGDAREKR
jgi:D-alanine-D-alanine ligase-like ATP-grasp enzyme